MSRPNRLAIFLTLGFLVFTPASPAWAWWNFWTHTRLEDPPPQPQPQTEKLQQHRESECVVTDGPNTRFGDTMHMRSKTIKPLENVALRRALVGIRLAARSETAEAIAASFLEGGYKLEKTLVQIALARSYLARKGLWKNALERAEELLSDPALTDNSDAVYLRASVAFSKQQWPEAQSQAHLALQLEPNFYNAAVLASLTDLRDIMQRDQSCEQVFSRLQESLSPVMDAGACPIHMGHYDLAAERLLIGLTAPNAERDRLLLKLILSFVARNQPLCNETTNQLSGTYPGECGAVLSALTCSGVRELDR